MQAEAIYFQTLMELELLVLWCRHKTIWWL